MHADSMYVLAFLTRILHDILFLTHGFILKTLQATSPKASTYDCDSALLKKNKDKNRFKNIIPRKNFFEVKK